MNSPHAPFPPNWNDPATTLEESPDLKTWSPSTARVESDGEPCAGAKRADIPPGTHRYFRLALKAGQE